MGKTLKNRSGRPQIYNLPHEQYCADGTCRCVEVEQFATTRDGIGRAATTRKVKRLAASVHFMTGETKSGLPDTILACPDIRAAIASRQVVEVKEQPKRQTKPPKPDVKPETDGPQ
jgi:hypothetical protein